MNNIVLSKVYINVSVLNQRRCTVRRCFRNESPLFEGTHMFYRCDKGGSFA